MASKKRSNEPEKIVSLSQLAERLRERIRERIASGDYTPGQPAGALDHQTEKDRKN